MTYTAPLDLYYWFVTFFAGNITIFMAIAFLSIALLASKFRMPGSITMIMFAIFIIMLSIYLQLAYLLVIIIGGLVVGYLLSKLFKF